MQISSHLCLGAITGAIPGCQKQSRGLQIKFCRTTGYGTLRKLGYPLPSNRALDRRLEGLRFLPGILRRWQKIPFLFLNELEIPTGYELDCAEDAFLGGNTLPPKPEEPANHALVFMLGGLNRRWKKVITYEFTGNHVEGFVLKHYVLDLVQLCSQVSLRVRVMTSDMSASNRAM